MGDPRKWLALVRRAYVASPRYAFLIVSFIYQNFSSFLAKFLWTSAGLIIAAIVIQGLTQRVTIVEPLSVPKSLADRGYSSEVAAQRFRDAIAKYMASANTRMKQPELALHAELPNIVVPTVGISLDAVMSAVRTLFRSTRSQSIAGEFTIAHDQLWLRLRLNGTEFYSSTEGGDPERPDDLLAIAVPEALKRTQPYFVAASLSNSDSDAALDLANWVISNLPEHDDNVAWAYNLKGSILVQRTDYEGGEAALQRALALNRKLAAAHLNLGKLRAETNRLSEAIAECREAVRLDPKYSLAHNNLAQNLRAARKTDEAIREFQEAIKLDPNDPIPHTNLGNTQRQLGNDDEAVLEYLEAIRARPTYSAAHYNYAIVLAAHGKFPKAVAENKEAIKYDPNNALAHNNLANSLRELGEIDEAIAEYREAVNINRKFIQARVNLAKALDQAGKRSEAQHEFQEVREIDPNNRDANEYLKAGPDGQKKSD